MAEAARRREAGGAAGPLLTGLYPGRVPYASVYPLVTSRAVARPFTYELEDGVGKGAIVQVPFGRRRARGIVVGFEDEPPEGIVPLAVEKVVGAVPPALVELALWLADYYGSSPARALALVAPELPKRRKEQARATGGPRR